MLNINPLPSCFCVSIHDFTILLTILFFLVPLEIFHFHLVLTWWFGAGLAATQMACITLPCLATDGAPHRCKQSRGGHYHV